jgi:hypothetical protein
MALMPPEELDERDEEDPPAEDPANDIFKHTFVDILDKKPSDEQPTDHVYTPEPM